jgi:AcrR family transcriptional regulator
MVDTGAMERPLRADAVRNRARILASAAEVFAERGLDVTLDDIAHHAGLGVGTVYRRFADRDSLIEALFEQRMQGARQRMRAALAAPDAWSALVDVIWEHCEEFAGDRGLRQVMLSSTKGNESLTQCRQEILLTLEQLVDRAKSVGTLRDDFHPSDIPVMFVMVAAVIEFAGSVQPDLWRRYLSFFLDAMRLRGADSEGDFMLDVTSPALDHQELMEAMGCSCPAPLRPV